LKAEILGAVIIIVVLAGGAACYFQATGQTTPFSSITTRVPNQPPNAAFTHLTPTRTLKHVSPIDKDVIVFLNNSGKGIADTLGKFFESPIKVAYGQSENVVEVPPALILPKIDGNYTSISELELSELGKELAKKDPNLMSQIMDEWNYDAIEIKLLPNPMGTAKAGEAYLRIKYDKPTDSFYGVIDHVSKRKIEPGDLANVFFDPKNHRLSAPLEDDIGMVWGWGEKTGEKTARLYLGTGIGWKTGGDYGELGIKVDCGLGKSPLSSEPHEIFEFRFPLDRIKQSDIVSFVARRKLSYELLAQLSSNWALSKTKHVGISFSYKQSDTRVNKTS